MKPNQRPTGKFSLPHLPKRAQQITESALKYVFAALLIFVPLYPKFPVFFLPGAEVAVRAEDFLILVLGLLLLPLIPSYFDRLKNNLVVRSMLLYWAIGLLAVFSASFITQTAPLSLGMFHWARRVEYMLPFIAAAILAANKDNLRFFLKLILPVALAVWGYALAQIYLDAPVISTQNEEFSKGIALTLQPGVNISSTFAGHYDLAGYLVATLAIVIALAVGVKSRSLRWIQLLALLPLFWLLMQTGSRIAFGASILVIPFVLILVKRPWWIVPVFIIALIGVANSPRLAGRFADVFRVLQFQTMQEQIKGVWDTRSQLITTPVFASELVENAVSPTPSLNPTPTPTPEPLRAIQQDRSTSIRFDVEWPRALRALNKNPLLGTGYASISLATDNDYLRALGETGVLGFAGWMSIFLALGSRLIRGLRRTKGLEYHYFAGTTGMVLGFLLIATFIDIFEASKNATLFWMYTGLAEGILWSKK